MGSRRVSGEPHAARIGLIGFAALSTGLLAPACKSVSGGAGEAFAKMTWCAPDRVTVVRRTDVAPHAVLSGDVTAPPAEVAADPDRLRYWNEQHRAALASLDSSCEVYEVSGCGKHALLCCAHYQDDTGQRWLGMVECHGPGGEHATVGD